MDISSDPIFTFIGLVSYLFFFIIFSCIFSSEVEKILQTTILQADVSKLTETQIYTNILEEVLAVRMMLVERLMMLRKGELEVCDGRMSQVNQVREVIVMVEEILLETVSVQTKKLTGLKSIANLLLALQAAINSQVMEILTQPPQNVSNLFKSPFPSCAL